MNITKTQTQYRAVKKVSTFTGTWRGRWGGPTLFTEARWDCHNTNGVVRAARDKEA